MPSSPFDVDELLMNFQRWLEAQSMEPLAAYAERLADQVPESTPVGTVLCLASNQDSLLAQTLAALTAGNGVLWPRAQPEDPVQTQALRVGLPALVKTQVMLTDWDPASDAVPDPLPDVVLYAGDANALDGLRQRACQWPNHPVAILACEEDIEDDFEIPLSSLQR